MAASTHQRASHIWKILVDPEAKTLNPPEGKDRNFKGGAWRLTKKDGKPYIDLMWSCGRTSFGDADLAQTGGCHSPAQSSQPKELQFTNQRMIYDKVMIWQNPVKTGLAEVESRPQGPEPACSPRATLGKAQKAQVQLMVNQAQDIVKSVKKDGSWGVHAPTYTKGKLDEAKVLVQGAKATLQGGARASVKAGGPTKG